MTWRGPAGFDLVCRGLRNTESLLKEGWWLNIVCSSDAKALIDKSRPWTWVAAASRRDGKVAAVSRCQPLCGLKGAP